MEVLRLAGTQQMREPTRRRNLVTLESEPLAQGWLVQRWPGHASLRWQKYGTLNKFACHPCAGAMSLCIIPILVWVLPKGAGNSYFEIWLNSKNHSEMEKSLPRSPLPSRSSLRVSKTWDFPETFSLTPLGGASGTRPGPPCPQFHYCPQASPGGFRLLCLEEMRTRRSREHFLAWAWP